MTPTQREELTAFYRDHLNGLIVHAYSYTLDWDLARDVVQDAFKKTIEPKKAEEFFSSENRVGWMKNMVKNTARNAVRSRNRELSRFISYQELHDKLATTDHYPSEDEDDTLERCIRRLDADEFALLKRVTLEKASCIEAAGELGISMWACYKRVKKIREKLRKILEDEKIL